MILEKLLQELNVLYVLPQIGNFFSFILQIKLIQSLKQLQQNRKGK
jgi:hypothetical protein